MRRRPSSHSSSSKSSSKLLLVGSASAVAILSPSSSLMCRDGGGGEGESGCSSLSAWSSSLTLALSAQGLAIPAARLSSGVGGSGLPPPLAAARVRGRFAGGDFAGGDKSTGSAVEGAAPAATSAGAGGALDRAALSLSARRCLLSLSRPGLRRRRLGGVASVGARAVRLTHRHTSSLTPSVSSTSLAGTPSFLQRSHASN